MSHRALRVLRISLLAGEMRSMHLSSSGALLSGAASIRLYQLIASVLTLLFTTSAIVRPELLPQTLSPCHLIADYLTPTPCSGPSWCAFKLRQVKGYL